MWCVNLDKIGCLKPQPLTATEMKFMADDMFNVLRDPM